MNPSIENSHIKENHEQGSIPENEKSNIVVVWSRVVCVGYNFLEE